MKALALDEKVITYNWRMPYQPSDADDEMRLRDRAAQSAREATRGTVISVNRGRVNMVVRVAVWS